MTDPKIENPAVASVRPVRDILGEPLTNNLPISPAGQWLIDQQAEIARLRAELEAERRKVEVAKAGLAEIKSRGRVGGLGMIYDIATRALAALTPSEKGEGCPSKP